MSAELGLGKIITETQRRDAIHIAVAPVAAAVRLVPGQHCGINSAGKADPGVDPPIGVVDPFLKGFVLDGEKFWLYLYPGSITTLRHEWSHPSFAGDGTPVASESEAWLRNYASGLSESYEDVLSHAKDYQDNGDYWCEGGRFEGEWVPDEFWTHYENVTGKKVKDRGSFYSCAC